jgi:hypothetical protein
VFLATGPFEGALVLGHNWRVAYSLPVARPVYRNDGGTRGSPVDATRNMVVDKNRNNVATPVQRHAAPYHLATAELRMP